MRRGISRLATSALASMPVDMRSDTITTPTEAMREAMMKANVGDDVYKEDTDTNNLQAILADAFGKEAAMFVPSGTMGNLLASIVHAGSRSAFPEIIVGDRSHAIRDEVGNMSIVARAHTRQIRTAEDGTLPMNLLSDAVLEAPDIHYATMAAVFLENTHSDCGGLPLPLSYTKAVGDLVRTGPRAENPVKLHCDGARLWNAAVAQKVSLHDIAQPFDTLTVCLSKGMGCPIGSVLLGDQAFMDQAIRARKMIGGAMRQTGFLASAALHALGDAEAASMNAPWRVKLETDHNNAKMIAATFRKLLGDKAVIDPQTNIVLVDAGARQAQLMEESAAANIHLGWWSGTKVRAALNCNVTPEMCREACTRLESLPMWR